MSINVLIPSVLRPCCRGAAEISVSADSVREALAEIERAHPALYSSVCNETGAVRQHVNIFINSALVADKDLDAELSPGDELAIFQAVSGG